MLKKNQNILRNNRQPEAEDFKKLYDTYFVYLCAIATKYVYNPEIAKEIVNDIFITIWSKSLSINSSIASYLRKSVQNKCLNYIRDQHIKSIPLSDAESELLTTRQQQLLADEHPLIHLENKELEEIIKTAIETLPPRCKEIFNKYLYHDKSYDEIAEELFISPSTVRGQIKIGLAKLKDLLEDIHPFACIFLTILLQKINL